MSWARFFFGRSSDEPSEELSMEEKSVSSSSKCGFCSMLSSLLRRAMCMGDSRRGSCESYYRELGDQDTVRLDDGVSQQSVEPIVEDIRSQIQLQPGEVVLHEVPEMKTKPLGTKFMTLNKRRRKPLVTRSLLADCALLDDVTSSQVQFILDRSANWRFNAFTLDNVSGGRALPLLGVHLFQTYGLISHFNLDPIKIWKLFVLIEEGYHSVNPYHNAIHAADVTQAMHCFLQQDRVRANMPPIEIMASILAAMAHDMDHPGVNQQFLIATSNHLARLYGNSSVLENHHWRAAMSCLLESGILEDIEEGSRGLLQSQISSLILATDITKQSEYLAKFRALLDTGSLDMTLAEHRHLVLQIALKCADISNPCRPWDISHQWSMKVCEEFFRQGDMERELNLPVSPLCDRHTTSIPTIQTGFFKFVVTPLIKAWDKFLGTDLSTQMLNNLQFNQNAWDCLAANERIQETHKDTAQAAAGDATLDTSSENQSESSELLPPTAPRRSSLNPSSKQLGLIQQLRRFSVPSAMLSEARFRERGDRACMPSTSQYMGNRSYPEHPESSGKEPGEQTHRATEKVISSEDLLPETTIASITTDVQATRVSRVIKGNWKLVRQQTFPPLEPIHSLASRSLHASKEDASRIRGDVRALDLHAYRKEDSKSSTTTVDTDKTKSNERVVESAGSPSHRETQSSAAERPLSRFQTNLASIPLEGLASNYRRKSVPTDATLSPKERKAVEALPQFLPRQGAGASTHRRGSAPSPDIRSLSSVSPLHSSNGARRTQSPMAACQQWLAKAQEIAYQRLPRRASLPVEVITGN